MKLPCSLICDLLPLYAEELTGEETNALIREHLTDCPDCRKKLEEARLPATSPIDSGGVMRALKKDLRRRRLRAAGTAALAVFVVLFTLLSRSMEEQPLPYEEGLIRVEGVQPYTEDMGGPPRGECLCLSYDMRVHGLSGETYFDDETGEETLYLQGWTDRWNVWRGKNIAEDEYGTARFAPVPDRVIYGFGPDQTLLWGEEMNGGVEILPRLALGYYAYIAAALAGALGLAWLLLRKKKTAPALRQLFFLPVSYLAGHLLVKGWGTLSFFLMRDLLFILLDAAAVCGLLTLGTSLLRQRKRDKE